MLAHFGPKFQVVNAAQADPLPTRIRLSAAYEVLQYFSTPADLSLWIRVEVEDRWKRPGESPSFYVGTELVAGSTDVIFVRASRASGEINQAAEIAFGLGLRYESFRTRSGKEFHVFHCGRE